MVVRVPSMLDKGEKGRGSGLTVALAWLTAVSAIPGLNTSLEVIFLDVEMELYDISHNRQSHPGCSIPS